MPTNASGGHLRNIRKVMTAGLLAGMLSLPFPAAAAAAECFGRDGDKATQCQLRVAGLYHALTTVQARYD